MAVFNQFSFVFFAVIGAGVLGLAMWRFRRPAHLMSRFAILGIYAAIAALFVLNLPFPDGNTTYDTYAEVEQVLTNGRPTFVMLYSQFCIGCIASLPAARSLENEIEEQGVEINMLFLDIHTDVGQVARERMSFEVTPTYLVYDTFGQEVLVSNTIPTVETILTAVTESVSGIDSAG